MMNDTDMRNPRKALQCFTVLWLSLCSIKPEIDAQTATEIAEKALSATVYLEMKNRNGRTIGGTGFFISQNQIATSFHIIRWAATGTAKQVGKSTKFTILGISASDPKNDLAILTVTAFQGEPLPLGNSDKIKIGETVYVAGNPKGLEGTFSNGIISGLREKHTRKRLQMTAPISRGSSGGPVLNEKGEVIGVSFATFKKGQNLNFAIPSNYLKAMLAQSSPPKPLTPEYLPIPSNLALIAFGGPFRDPHFPNTELSTYEVNQNGKIHISKHKISREHQGGQDVYVISTDLQRMVVKAGDLRPIMIEQRDDAGQLKYSIEYYKRHSEQRVRFIYPGPKRNVVKEIRNDSYDVNTILEVMRGYPFSQEKVKFILVTADHVIGVYAKIKAEHKIETPLGIFDCYFIEAGVSGLKGKIANTKFLFWIEKEYPFRVIKQMDSKDENIITLVEYEVMADER